MITPLCHCGQPARNDDSDYAIVCTQWPLCERRCDCMTEDAGDGTERVLTHSLSCPQHPERAV